MKFNRAVRGRPAVRLACYIAGGLLLAALLLGVAERGVLVPLHYLLWLMRNTYNALPKTPAWFFLSCGLCLWIALVFLSCLRWRSWLFRRSDPGGGGDSALEIRGTLLRACRGAELPWVLARRLEELFLELEALRSGRDLEELQRDYWRGELAMPEQLAEVLSLQPAARGMAARARRRFALFLGSREDQSAARSLERALDILEDQLENAIG